MFPYFIVVSVEIELMIGLFLVFEVIEPQGNYMEELYDPGEQTHIDALLLLFLHRISILYISNMHILQLS